MMLGSGSLALVAGGCGGEDGGPTTAPVATPVPTPVPAPAPSATQAPPLPGRNLALAAQDWTSAIFAAQNGAVISDTVTQDVVVDGTTIRLRQITLPDVASLIRYAPLESPFVTGRTYLISFYVRLGGTGESFGWSRQVGRGGRGHEPKLLTSTVRRIWTIVRAVSAANVATVTDPATALAVSSEQGTPVLLCRGSYATGPITVLAGGLQIEEIAGERQAIALIGDSTQNFDSNVLDAQGVQTPAKWLAGELNVPVFNRAISGNTTGNMLDRWDADMAPLAANARWAVIQGGINDVNRGTALPTIQANLTAMFMRAQSNGMLPVVCTATPTHYATAQQRPVRDRLNEWIRATFPRIIDLDAGLRDPRDPQQLLSANTQDGTHYTASGGRAAGLLMADQPFWDRAVATRYEPVD